MKNSTWKDYVEIVGITAIVASLIFVGLQIRQDRVIAVASVQAVFLESFVQIRSDINQNAEIWDTGLAGGELSGADAKIFSNLAATLRRQAVMESNLLQLLGGQGHFSTVQFADLIRRNPGLEKEMAKENARVLTHFAASSTPPRDGRWPDQVQEAIERLNQLEPLPDSL